MVWLRNKKNNILITHSYLEDGGPLYLSSGLQPKFINTKIDHMISHMVSQAMHRLIKIIENEGLS